jgi:hypothetical protein
LWVDWSRRERGIGAFRERVCEVREKPWSLFSIACAGGKTRLNCLGALQKSTLHVAFEAFYIELLTHSRLCPSVFVCASSTEQLLLQRL